MAWKKPVIKWLIWFSKTWPSFPQRWSTKTNSLAQQSSLSIVIILYKLKSSQEILTLFDVYPEIHTNTLQYPQAWNTNILWYPRDEAPRYFDTREDLGSEGTKDMIPCLHYCGATSLTDKRYKKADLLLHDEVTCSSYHPNSNSWRDPSQRCWLTSQRITCKYLKALHC